MKCVFFQTTVLPSSLNASSYVWAYGVEGVPGTFARIGLVGFDNKKRVTSALSPIFPQAFLNPDMEDMPLAEESISTALEVFCELEPLEYNQDGALLNVTVSLINGGKKAFSFEHDQTGMAHKGVHELYDEKRNVIFRIDWRSFFTPYSTHRDEWPILTVNPGQKVIEYFEIWSFIQGYGELLPGTYYLRYLFPFERKNDLSEHNATIKAHTKFIGYSSVIPLTIPLRHQHFFSSNIIQFCYKNTDYAN